jgi:hypothetical protein
MSMPTFTITWLLSYKLIVKMHCMTWYTGTCGITVMGLPYRLNDIVKCVCYMGIGSNGCFVTGTALTNDHYKTGIINSVGHLKSDSVVLLILCTVAYNIWGTSVVLQVPWDSVNPTEEGNISGRPYMRVMTYKELCFYALKYLSDCRR